MVTFRAERWYFCLEKCRRKFAVAVYLLGSLPPPLFAAHTRIRTGETIFPMARISSCPHKIWKLSDIKLFHRLLSTFSLLTLFQLIYSARSGLLYLLQINLVNAFALSILSRSKCHALKATRVIYFTFICCGLIVSNFDSFFPAQTLYTRFTKKASCQNSSQSQNMNRGSLFWNQQV
jgi:hypothetical protein